MMKTILASLIALAALAALATPARAEIKKQTVEYKHGKVVLEGYLAYDDAVKGKRPTVIVVSEWKGIDDHTRDVTERLAKLGYTAFAADMYGKGIHPADNEAAAAEAGKYKKDRKLMRARITAALTWAKKQPQVDPAKIAAIGFCFGGTTVLELARSGAPVLGVVTFHGGLDSPSPADGKNIKGKVLVLHGADDPFNPPEQIAAFQKELRDANVDWQMIEYGGAVHSFTNPAAGNDKSKGAAYDEKADRRSWEAMKTFLAELFQ